MNEHERTKGQTPDELDLAIAKSIMPELEAEAARKARPWWQIALEWLALLLMIFVVGPALLYAALLFLQFIANLVVQLDHLLGW